MNGKPVAGPPIQSRTDLASCYFGDTMMVSSLEAMFLAELLKFAAEL
jgi:hypothetical protein